MADTIDGVTATGRHTGNGTVRYLFTEGVLKGFALGGTGRYAEGRLRGAVNIGGTNLKSWLSWGDSPVRIGAPNNQRSVMA
jgi:hypothetical protein